MKDEKNLWAFHRMYVKHCFQVMFLTQSKNSI